MNHDHSLASFSPPSSQHIDPDALAAGVHRYLGQNQAFIALPGVDPSTVDFRTFYPYNPSEVKHRQRTSLDQRKILEDAFKLDTKPNKARRQALGEQVGMKARSVQIWFQNRRAKAKQVRRRAQQAPRPTQKHESSPSDNSDDRTAVGNSPESDHGDADEPSPEDVSSQQVPSPDSPSQSVKDLISASTSPPTDPPPKREPSGSPSGLGVSRRSWHTPVQSPNPNSQEAHVALPSPATATTDDVNAVNLRRGSLPTHIGLGSRPAGAGFGPPPSSFRQRQQSYAGIAGAGSLTHDPFSRRRSLERLADHPYAHVAIAANRQIYGPNCIPPPRIHTPHSSLHMRHRPVQPIQTPELPTTAFPGTTSSVFAPGAEASRLPDHRRPELMHRASMPPQLSAFEVSPHVQHAHSQSQGDAAFRTQSVHSSMNGASTYISARSYQEPIPGPLPAPDFSFGVSTPGSSSESESGDAGSSMNGHRTSFTFDNFTFPANSKPDVDGIDHTPPYDAFAPRFGSIASVADSESSITSGFYSEMGSFEARPSTSHSLSSHSYLDERRGSCGSGAVSELLSHMHVQNHSRSSLSVPNRNSHELNQGPFTQTLEVPPPDDVATSTYPSPTTTLTEPMRAIGDSNGYVSSSELAHALHHPPMGSLSASGLPVASPPSKDDNVSPPNSMYAQSSAANTSTSLPVYPQSVPPHHAGPSGSASSSSLVTTPPLHLDVTEFQFERHIDFVSDTGHYSPIDESRTASFEFMPMSLQTVQEAPHEQHFAHDTQNGFHQPGPVTPSYTGAMGDNWQMSHDSMDVNSFYRSTQNTSHSSLVFGRQGDGLAADVGHYNYYQ